MNGTTSRGSSSTSFLATRGWIEASEAVEEGASASFLFGWNRKIGPAEAKDNRRKKRVIIARIVEKECMRLTDWASEVIAVNDAGAPFRIY